MLRPLLVTVFTFSSIKGTDVPLLSLASWPSAEDLQLDDSQFKALQMALTKEFAVIQGPPGTGKTYIGLKVDLANIIVRNFVGGV